MHITDIPTINVEKNTRKLKTLIKRMNPQFLANKEKFLFYKTYLYYIYIYIYIYSISMSYVSLPEIFG